MRDVSTSLDMTKARVSTRGRERGNGISRMIRFKNRLGWLSSRQRRGRFEKSGAFEVWLAGSSLTEWLPAGKREAIGIGKERSLRG
jgi:hypothetical protein